MYRHVLLTLALVACASGHGLMADPPQRGILGGASKFTPDLVPIDDAPDDFYGHFPAGDKSSRPGAGKASQERAGDFKWSMYEPTKPGFRFRSGVCGDLKDKPEHLRGGEYYYDGMITRTYKQGGIIEVRNAIVTHHNGYVEMHACDVNKCGGEISEKCFRDGYCRALRRAPNAECDGGMSKNCGPIDSNYPTRWYLPCSTQSNGNGFDDYLGKYAQFQLPEDWVCEHCVLQWFYTTGNNCNVPGTVEYFKGLDRPKNWGRCAGQAGAIGGFTDVQNTCGEGNLDDQFPEEYLQCADISIEASGRVTSLTSSTPATTEPATTEPVATEPVATEPVITEPVTAAPTITMPVITASTPVPVPVMEKSNGAFKYFNFIADGRIVRSFTDSLKIDISSYTKIAFEAVTAAPVRPVDFYKDGVKVWDESTPPYFLYGNRGRVPRYFNKAQLDEVLGKPFTLEVRWQEESLVAVVEMYN